MTREEAAAILGPYIARIEQYEAVPLKDAATILGDEVFGRLRADKIRCLGPTPDTVYPWNVIDYMTHPELNAPADNTGQPTRVAALNAGRQAVIKSTLALNKAILKSHDLDSP